MSEHPNATRVRQLFRAFREHDLDAIRDAIAENAVWHFPGRTGQLAGSHEGHAGIFAFLARVSELTGDTFELDLGDVLANDAHAIALFRGHAQRSGRTLYNPTCLVIRFEAGRAIEIREFVWDSYDVDEFWT